MKTEIKAEELRIGNLVYSPEDKVNIQITACDLFMMDNGNPRESRFEPIPLTEEKLIEMGMEKEDMADLGVHVYIPISEDSDMCLSFSGGTIWLEEHDTGIRYVHQLQNAYYALTQTELK